MVLGALLTLAGLVASVVIASFAVARRRTAA
jgi:hypothetical protein